MRRIPDILNISLKSFARSCFSNQAISIPFHSYSNNTTQKLDCQLSDKQENNCNEFLSENLTTSEFKVFKVLMELYLKHKGVLHPSFARIASMAGCARSTVQIAISKLKKLNIITTESRGYRQTLRYHIHEFYLQNRNKIASLVKNVFMVATLLLSSSAGALGSRYVLKEKDAYLIKSSKNGEKNVALQLTAAHYQEIEKHPKWIFERTLAIFEKKLKNEADITNHTGYFMGIFRQEVANGNAQPSTKSRQFRTKDPKTGTTKPYVRPKSGPYAEYIHPPERKIESDFDIATKLEMKLHANPNIFSKIAADGHLAKLTKENRNTIMMKAHKDCECRPNLGIEV